MAQRRARPNSVESPNAPDDIQSRYQPATGVRANGNGALQNGNGHDGAKGARARRLAPKPYDSGSLGLWKDLITMRWMRVPESSLKLLVIPIVLWANWEIVAKFVPLDLQNPFSRLLFISHRIPTSSDEDPRFQKGYYDLSFVAYYVVVFSFVRLFWTVYIFHPMGRYFGLPSEGKVIRFGEQGYAVVYFLTMAIFGLYVMRQLPTWYFIAEPIWTYYPQWDMKPALKTYYLLHSAYWLQQFLVLILKLEKPRDDYAELVGHHLVSLWLIGWSYLINLTWIGNMIYFTMDISDVFLGATKMFNYLQFEKTANAVFLTFVCVWTYTRHYLNIVLLWSVWYEFDKIPEHAKFWRPSEGVWMLWWMKYQIFVPILLLQLLNLFWYYRIWRILLHAIFSSELNDDRSDVEDNEEEDKKDD